MIVSRTPLRISFLGGGSDYPGWFHEHGGAVLSSTIDKYCYLTVRRLPPFFEHKNRIVYRVIETTRAVGEIRHPTVRAVLEHLQLEDMEIHHDADLPARAGMGTSSAFTVGLLHACHALLGHEVSRSDLAAQAIHLEQTILKETVGNQDQVAAAYGGLNRIGFARGDRYSRIGPDFAVEPLNLPRWRMDELASHLLLFFTGVSRTASEVADTFVPSIANSPALVNSTTMVETGRRILADLGPIESFGEILHEGWIAKRSLSTAISSESIDEIYAAARRYGAIGGKLLGAGGGGFFLVFARPRDHAGIKAALPHLLQVPFRFEATGSKIIVSEP